MRTFISALVLSALLSCSNEAKFSNTPAKGISADAKPDEISGDAETPVAVPLPEPEPAPAPLPEPAEEPVAEAPVPEPIPVQEALPPGERVEQFGVNFEDTPGGDADFNDAVLCFVGSFVRDGKVLTSIAKQKVEFSTISDAGCSLKIEVTILHKDGSVDLPRVFDAKAKDIFLLDFEKGDSLDAVMLPVSAQCGGPNARREMTDDVFAKIESACRQPTIIAQ